MKELASAFPNNPNLWQDGFKKPARQVDAVNFTPKLTGVEFIQSVQIPTSKPKTKIKFNSIDTAYLLPVKIKSRILPVRVESKKIEKQNEINKVDNAFYPENTKKNSFQVEVQDSFNLNKYSQIKKAKATSTFNSAVFTNNLTTAGKRSLFSNVFKASKRSNKKVLSMVSVSAAFMLFVSLLTSFSANGFSLSNPSALPQVAGVKEQLASPEDVAYKNWIEKKNNGVFISRDTDSDQDGLANSEEFLLDTNPLSPNTCSKDKTDSQLLIELINPKTCLALSLQSEEEFKLFSLVLNVAQVKENIAKKYSEQKVEPAAIKDLSVLGLFGVKNYNELESITSESVEQSAKLSSIKVNYLQQIQKIEKYMLQYRSYEQYDRDYELPVNAGKYLDVSIKYNTPLKYVLALARNESRFGTDRFTKDGTPTRPGAYKNIYSIGLTGSSSFGYNSWEDGVEAFGKWYKNLNDKGVNDCRKWRIYNPNGDYCTKIEGLAGEIQSYLDK